MNALKSSPPLGLFFSALFAAMLFALIAPIEHVIYFFSDDAYYYFQVALNIIHGKGSTFDGFSPTNGYHPIWMLTLLPIYEFFSSDKTIPLRIVFILQALLATGSLYACWRITSTEHRWPGYLGLALLLLLAPPHILLMNGLETGLLIFWVFLLLAIDESRPLFHPDRNPLQNFVVGLLLGILVLIRLDSAYIIIALTVFSLVLKSDELSYGNHLMQLIQRYAITVGSFCLLVMPYFLWNYTQYGHITPVSGAVKSSFPVPHLSIPPTPAYPYLLAFGLTIAWVGIALVLPNSSLRRKLIPAWRNYTMPRFLPVLWLGCLLHLLWTLLFMQWAVFQWHFAAYVPLLVITYCRFFTSRIQSIRVGKILVTITTTFLILYSSLVIYDKGLQHLNRFNAALWAKQHTDTDTLFAIHDSGVFAYFSERPTINLDGLINSFQYQEVIANKQLPEYFSQHKLAYIADAYQRCERKDKPLLIQAYRGANYQSPIGYYYRTEGKNYFYRSEPLQYRPLSENKFKCFAIWKYQPNRLQEIPD